MSTKPKESAESLYKFFQQLAPSGEEAEDDEINYASAGVARRALEACKMLMAIHHIMGVKPAAQAAEGEAKPSGAGDEALKQDLSEAKAEIDRMLLQTMELNKQNKSLKEKVAFLQKQVERLYNKREMAQNLERIENKKMTSVEQLAEDEAAAGKEPAEPGGEAPKKSLNKELAEELQIEAAARAPKEESDAEEKGKA